MKAPKTVVAHASFIYKVYQVVDFVFIMLIVLASMTSAWRNNPLNSVYTSTPINE